MTKRELKAWRNEIKGTILRVAQKRVARGAQVEHIREFQKQLLDTWNDPDIREFIQNLDKKVFPQTDDLKWFIDRLHKVAKAHGVNASIKKIGNELYGNINGVSFKIMCYRDFEKRCIELKNYELPELLNLTERIVKIEEAFIGSMK